MSLCSINWLVCWIRTLCVSCAVRNAFLNVSYRISWLKPAETYSPRHGPCHTVSTLSSHRPPTHTNPAPVHIPTLHFPTPYLATSLPLPEGWAGTLGAAKYQFPSPLNNKCSVSPYTPSSSYIFLSLLALFFIINKQTQLYFVSTNINVTLLWSSQDSPARPFDKSGWK